MSEGNQLGALLLERKLLTREQLTAALEEQARSRKSLGRVLVDQGIVEEADLVATLAAQIGLDFVDLGEYSVDPTAASMISPALARRYQAVPVGWDDGRLVVAMADPSNVFAVDDIRTITGAEVKVVVGTRTAILDVVERHQQLDGDVEDISAQAASEADGGDDDLARVKEV